MIIDEDMIALVTGGASGLGKAVAKALNNRGAKVTIFDLDCEAGESLAAKIKCQFVKVDVSDPESVAIAFQTAKDQNGTARIVFNCAGLCPAEKTVSRGNAHATEKFTKTININLLGSLYICSQAAKAMAELKQLETGERGVIVNTASIAAFDGQMGQVAYAASKGGIVSMTLPMARDLAALGIRVMAIAPGIFKTPMVEAFPEEIQDQLGKNIPFPSRLGCPDEFASLGIHICENPMLNGEVIRLDGGFRMPPK